MDWLIENPQVIFLVLFGVASLIKARWDAKKQAQEKEAQDWLPREPVPLEDDKSYRKVMPPPLPSHEPETITMTMPAPAAAPATKRTRVPARRDDAEAAVQARAQEAAARIYQQQQELAAHLQQIREAKAGTRGGNEGGTASGRSRGSGAKKKKPVAAVIPIQKSIRSRMNNPSELRRAVIMREILDRPVGLR